MNYLGTVPNLVFAKLVEVEQVVEYQEYGWLFVTFRIHSCLYGTNRLKKVEGFYECDESEESFWENSCDLLGILRFIDRIKFLYKKLMYAIIFTFLLHTLGM